MGRRGISSLRSEIPKPGRYTIKMNKKSIIRISIVLLVVAIIALFPTSKKVIGYEKLNSIKSDVTQIEIKKYKEKSGIIIQDKNEIELILKNIVIKDYKTAYGILPAKGNCRCRGQYILEITQQNGNKEKIGIAHYQHIKIEGCDDLELTDKSIIYLKELIKKSKV